MAEYKVVMQYPDGTEEEQDEVFSTRSEAKEYGDYLCSCYHSGMRTLNMSNPGDYPLDDDDDDIDYEIIRV